MLGYNISTYSQEEPYNKVADELQGEDYYEGKMSIMDILEDMQASIEDKENEL